MSKVTFWPSASVDSPARSTAEMCTNTSLPPLDWQMWFAAYRSVAENAWFEGLTQQLLKGSPAVLSLLARNPFPNLPPKYVRALLYEYRFADTSSPSDQGAAD